MVRADEDVYLKVGQGDNCLARFAGYIQNAAQIRGGGLLWSTFPEKEKHELDAKNWMVPNKSLLFGMENKWKGKVKVKLRA